MGRGLARAADLRPPRLIVPASHAPPSVARAEEEGWRGEHQLAVGARHEVGEGSPRLQVDAQVAAHGQMCAPRAQHEHCNPSPPCPFCRSRGPACRAAKLVLISSNCPPLRKSEIEYYAMLAKTGVHHYTGSEPQPLPPLPSTHLASGPSGAPCPLHGSIARAAAAPLERRTSHPPPLPQTTSCSAPRAVRCTDAPSSP